MSKSEDQPSRFIEAVSPLLPSSVWKSTVPIVEVRGSRLCQFGTGTVLRIADAAFLVTAAHVALAMRRDGVKYALGAPSGSFTDVSGDWITSAPGQYGFRDDPFDVAVLKLGEKQVSALFGIEYLQMDDVSDAVGSGRFLFCLCGFPSVWSTPSEGEGQALSLKPFQFTTYEYEGSTSGLGTFEPRFHLLLNPAPDGIRDHDGNEVSMLSYSGYPTRFPKDLGGISGCSVWRIADTQAPRSDWSNRGAKWVGIQTGVYPEAKAIKATRWIAVRTVLWEAFPNLRPALSLWTPTS